MIRCTHRAFHPLFPRAVFALSRKCCEKTTGTRKTRRKGACGKTKRERGNFSCAKYHADWLEVMKFWWLIKCKKIYRLRHLPLSLSLSCALSLSLSLSISLFPSLASLPSGLPSFRVFRRFSFASLHLDLPSSSAASRVERKRAVGGDDVKFKTRGNRLGVWQRRFPPFVAATFLPLSKIGVDYVSNYFYKIEQ